MASRYASAYLTEAAAIRTGPGGVHTITLTAAGDTATLTLYDNTAGSGTVIAVLSALTNTTVNVTLDVPCSIGMYAAFTGTTPKATVSYW